MGLDAILAGIREEVQAQIADIQRKAQEEARRILAEAQQEAEQIAVQADSEALPHAHREQASILQHARLEALHITENAFLEQVNAAIEDAREHLSEARAGQHYPELLSRLIEEALHALEPSLRPGEAVHLLADPRDRGLIEAQRQGLPEQVEIFYNLHTWGGVNAASEDEKVWVLNTLEVRLERAIPELQRQITTQLRKQVGEA